jgi:signal transduction histidine kinase
MTKCQEYINIAAHELRTPAQSILGYAELAKTDPQIEKQTLPLISVLNTFSSKGNTEYINKRHSTYA